MAWSESWERTFDYIGTIVENLLEMHVGREEQRWNKTDGEWVVPSLAFLMYDLIGTIGGQLQAFKMDKSLCNVLQSA